MTTEDPDAQRTSGQQDAPIHAGDRSGSADALGASAPTEPVDLPIRTLVLVGTAVWTLALVVTLVVPSLHTAERSWWPWACVSGIALGAFALWYVRRGTGIESTTLARHE